MTAVPARPEEPADAAASSFGAWRAVDLLDFAARLEMSGVTDSVARTRHGKADVFSLATSLHRDEDGWSHETGLASAPSGVAEALRRAFLLVIGVVLAAAVLNSLLLPATAVWVIGAAGWIGGQVVAAIAWTRLGFGEGPTGLRKAGFASLLVVVAAALAPVLLVPGAAVLPTALVSFLWTAYACAVSILVCARRTRSALLVMLCGLLVVGVAMVAGQEWSPALVAGLAAATAGVLIVLAAVLVLKSGRLSVPTSVDWRAAAPAALQAALLATSLLVLVRTVPTGSSTALVTASVAGAAMADPVVAILRSGLRRSAGHLYLVRAAARRARQAAVLAAAATALVSAGVAVLVVLALQAHNADWAATVVPAAAFTAVATTSAALTAFAAPWRAVLAASAAFAYAAGVLVFGGLAVVLVFPIALLLAVTLLLRRVSDPRVVV
jgi:hypothetical protein